MYSFEIKQYKKTDDGVYLKVFIRDKEILDEIMKYKTKCRLYAASQTRADKRDN